MSTVNVTGSSNDMNLVVNSTGAYITDSTDAVNSIIASSQSLIEELRNDYIKFLLNGREITIESPEPELSLVNFLRDKLHLTGTKVSCTQGLCGVCVVMLTYKDAVGLYHTTSANSCLLKLVNCHGKSITTIEGMNNPEDMKAQILHPIQLAFHELSAMQCGYCTPGFIMQIYSSLQNSNNLPTFENLENQLSGNICRCTGFRPIIEAYKCILIGIVEDNNNSITQNRITGSTDSNNQYNKEYNTLKSKWAINGTNGLPSYNFTKDNIWVTDNAPNLTIKKFIDNIVKRNYVGFESKIYNYGNIPHVWGKYYIINSLDNLDNLMLNLQTSSYGSYTISDIMFVDALTSHGIPNMETLVRNKIMVQISEIKELNTKEIINNNYKFGASVKQSDLIIALAESGDEKYENIAEQLQYVAPKSVRNIASWIGGVMLTLKHGFRGDWSTILNGAGALFNYYVYSDLGVNRGLETNKTYAELEIAVGVRTQLILVESVTIPKRGINEKFRYYRTALRLQSCNADINATISATKVGLSYTKVKIVVGAASGNYLDPDSKYKEIAGNKNLQELSSDGPFLANNSDNMKTLFDLVDNSTNLVIKSYAEPIHVNPKTGDNSSRTAVKGFIYNFFNDDFVDIKTSKRSGSGDQTFNSGSVENTTDDYRTLSLDGSANVHKMIKDSAQIENITYEQDTGAFAQAYNKPESLQRDQTYDFKPKDNKFKAIGRPDSLNSFYKVQGKTTFGSEVLSSALHLHMISSNCAKGECQFNTTFNQELLTKWRNYPGVEMIIVNDEWFNTHLGDSATIGTINNNITYDHGVAGAVNAFNNNLYAFGTKTQFSAGFIPDSAYQTPFEKKITYYGQIIGGVIAENHELARYVARELTNNLDHIEDTPLLEWFDSYADSSYGTPIFDQYQSQINDENTLSRTYAHTFGSSFGRTAGLMLDISDNSNAPTLAGTGNVYLGSLPAAVGTPTTATVATANMRGFYKKTSTDGTHAVVSNAENEAKGPFFATNINEGSYVMGQLPLAGGYFSGGAAGPLTETLGNGLGGFLGGANGTAQKLAAFGRSTETRGTTPGAGLQGAMMNFHGVVPAFPAESIENFVSTSNNWMRTNDNHKKWETDASLSDYQGTCYNDAAQSHYPTEGTSMTLRYENDNTIVIHGGWGDALSVGQYLNMSQQLKPQMGLHSYDNDGNFVGSDKADVIKFNPQAMGGHFGAKFLWTTGSPLAFCILALQYLRRPIKYIDHWSTGDNHIVGRYNMLHKNNISVNSSTNKITTNISDTYMNLDKNSILAGIATMTSTHYLHLANVVDQASRATMLQSNIGKQVAVRGFGQVECQAMWAVTMSKASALLKQPHHVVTLNNTLYEADRTLVGPGTSARTSILHGLFANNAQYNSYQYGPLDPREMVFKEEYIAILKNLQKTPYPEDVSSATYYTNDVVNDASNSVQLTNIVSAFDKYYKDNVTEFNSKPENKFKKRGMGLHPSVYQIYAPFNSNCKVGVSINSQSLAVDYSVPIIDTGTGSYLKGIQVLADVLKLDSKAINYNTSSDIANHGFLHSGSTGAVQNIRATLNAGIKTLHEILDRFPINQYYSGSINAILHNGTDAPNALSTVMQGALGLPSLPADCSAQVPRIYNGLKSVLVDTGVADPNTGGTTNIKTTFYVSDLSGSVDLCALDPLKKCFGGYINVPGARYAIDPSTNPINVLGTTYTVSGETLVGLSNTDAQGPLYYYVSKADGALGDPLGQGPFIVFKDRKYDLSNNGTSEHVMIYDVSYAVTGVANKSRNIDLRTKTGAEIVQLWKDVYKCRATVRDGSVIHNHTVPDLHREIIVRTLEFEYPTALSNGAEFPIPVSPDNGKTMLAVLTQSGLSAMHTEHYQRLTNTTRTDYIETIENEHMMARWPMIVQFIFVTFNGDQSPGAMGFNFSPTGSTGGSVGGGPIGVFQYMFKGFSHAIGETTQGGGGGQQFGCGLGGAKMSPLNPELDKCGLAEAISAGSTPSALFTAKGNSIIVEGNTIDDPHWIIDWTSDGLMFEITNVLTTALCVSEVDMLTGEYIHKRCELVSNVDRSINPRADIGQIEGGFIFGMGNVTTENSSKYLANGSKLQHGHWNYKCPTAMQIPEIFNVQLLNRDDAYVKGTLSKGVGEVATPCGAVVGEAVRDAIRNYRESVSFALSGSAITDPFAQDASDSGRHSCNYMMNLHQVTPEKIRFNTSVSSDILAYLATQ